MDYDYKALCNEICQRGINLFGSFDEWTKGAFALSNLGEDGREIFMSISSIADCYRERESRLKFNNALKTSKKVSVASFIYQCQQAGIDTNKYLIKDESYYRTTNLIQPIKVKTPPTQPSFIPWEYVEKSASYKSTFIDYLRGIFDTETIKTIGDNYKIGATKDRGVIFWQIDTNNKVHEGKIMKYDVETGHRSGVSFVGYLLAQRGLFNTENRQQCLFGQHLLGLYPEKTVAVVEAEKTAIICSAVFPQYIWLSCGSMGLFNKERLMPLAGRTVIAFPDTDPEGKFYKTWLAKSKEIDYCRIMVSNVLECHASDEEKRQKIDIADWITKTLAIQTPVDYQNTLRDDSRLECQQGILDTMIAENPAIALLIDKFCLELVKEQ